MTPRDRLLNLATRLDIAKDVFILLVCSLLITAMVSDVKEVPFIVISVFALTGLLIITIVLSGIMKAARND